ncbi:hypothetical protein [Streptomyces erythrochromogenes]|uniref:hypothetical protein n=1 Tax=Streptomyces erythrochromogenes TaxID=285574 RepID=UPI0004CCDCB4|nr:hypothetical protein [Streptomyces erythrochromogenes]
MTTTAEQIAGETAALDLMSGYLAADPDAVAAALETGTACTTTTSYMRQHASGLLHDAVLADPDFSPHRRAAMGPAGIAWLEGVPMEEPVAATVLALAGDGGDPRILLNDTQWIIVYAVSAVARCVAVHGVDGTEQRLHRVRATVSGP